MGLAPLVIFASLSWVTDPKAYDKDLVKHLCQQNHTGSCGASRQCELDLTLSKDKAQNSQCPKISDSEHYSCFTCLHKSLLPDISTFDILSFFALFGAGVLAGMSGIGGGGLNVPLLMLTNNFYVKEAVPLSHVAVFGNAIAQNTINSRRRHPQSNVHRPLIDFDLPLLLLPAQLAGNSMGVLVGKLLPSTPIEVVALALLLFAATKTARTAFKMYLREQKELLIASQATPKASVPLNARVSFLRRMSTTSFSAFVVSRDPDPITAPLPMGVSSDGQLDTTTQQSLHTGPQGGLTQRDPPGLSSGLLSPQEQEEAAAALPLPSADESGGFLATIGGKLSALVAFWLLFVLDDVGVEYLGGKKFCSAGHWGWLGGLYVASVLVILVASRGAIASQEARDAAGVPHTRGDVIYTPRKIIVLPIAGCAVGVVSGLLGLGGGELMAPLLLALGMLPQVASATSAFMVLFTSSSDLVKYTFTGVLAPDMGYVVMAFIIGGCAATIGRMVGLRVTAKLTHPSLIAVVLAIVLYLALILLAIQVAGQSANFKIGNPCD